MTPLLPGSTIGILGGGQLGRMLALEAHRLGYKIWVLDPTPFCPASQVADTHLCAPFDDLQALSQLATSANVVTYETEHIPLATLRYCSNATSLYPSASLLTLVQDRLTQRQFLTDHRIPQTPYAAVDHEHSLALAVQHLGLPAILKSRRGGYDGKGQAQIRNTQDLHSAWAAIGQAPAILEAHVPFRSEISVILARSIDGEARFFPVAENVHRHNILHTTRAPARIPSVIRHRAEALARTIADALDYCGVMTVEMFLLDDATLLVNEIAPRVHNSGHYTFGACVTSQFEQHLRAICRLPLGDTTQLRPAVMLNLLGDMWRNGTPHWQAVLAHPNTRLYLYGKEEARTGRKMGHVLLLGEDTDVLLQQVARIHTELCSPEREQQNEAPSSFDGTRQSVFTDGVVLRTRDSQGYSPLVPHAFPFLRMRRWPIPNSAKDSRGYG